MTGIGIWTPEGRRKDSEAGMPGWGTAMASKRVPWSESLSQQGVKGHRKLVY